MAADTELFDNLMGSGGLRPAEYLAGMTINGETAREMYEAAWLTEEERHDIEESCAIHGGKIHIVAMTADWCGDAAVNLPLAFRMSDLTPGVETIVLRAEDHPSLESRLKAEGYNLLPVLLFFDARGKELGRFMQRPQAAQPKVDKFFEGKPDADALMASGDPESVARAIGIFEELIAEMKEWYKEGLWRETAKEWLAILSR